MPTTTARPNSIPARLGRVGMWNGLPVWSTTVALPPHQKGQAHA